MCAPLWGLIKMYLLYYNDVCTCVGPHQNVSIMRCVHLCGASSKYAYYAMCAPVWGLIDQKCYYTMCAPVWGLIKMCYYTMCAPVWGLIKICPKLLKRCVHLCGASSNVPGASYCILRLCYNQNSRSALRFA